MIDWLHTIRWKNLLIIWISIVVIVLPHFDPAESGFFEFILWAIICSTIAAIGNITNDLLDIKQDRENKKKNIFSGGGNKRTAYIIIFLLLGICTAALFASRYMIIFSILAFTSLLLLLLYNLFLKKIVLIGNLIIAILTALIFVGVDMIVLSRLIYFEFGFENKQIELLACFAFITTLVREMIKDAEDRKGDLFAGFFTIAKYLKDKWIGILVIMISIGGIGGTYILMTKRHINFMDPFYYYSAWTLVVTLLSGFYMMSNNPSKYIRATRIIKAGMIGCLGIYLFLSL